MNTEIKVPVLPESVTEATVATWHKKPGEPVKRDERLADIETDKVVLEVSAPSDGRLESISKETGSVVKSGEVIGVFVEEALKPAESPKEASKPALKLAVPTPDLSPSVRQMVSEQAIDVEGVKGSGKHGRIVKEDLMPKNEVQPQPMTSGDRPSKRVPMTRLRATIADRLLSAQQNAAILTTFNEINMEPVIALRKKYKDKFEKDYGVRLGFMSFFTVAVVEALKRFPIINASVEGRDIIYHGYYDISIAVSSPRGLVVPVLRDADQMHMADIERKIAEFSNKAQEGTLSIEEMSGGTFTISNGGVFGSLMSTPILNPPQSAILGLHKIEDRPISIEGKLVICPMMYVAMSYDHRIIDGVDSVKFLVTVKELLEDPARLILEI